MNRRLWITGRTNDRTLHSVICMASQDLERRVTEQHDDIARLLALSREQSRRMSRLDTRLNLVQEDVRALIGVTLQDQMEINSEVSGKQAEHDTRFDRLDIRLGHHGVVLAEQSVSLAEHDARFDRIDATLAEHGATLAEHGAMLAEHGAKLAEHSAKLAEHDARFDRIDATLAELLGLVRTLAGGPGS
ncbi:hypothetical protein [Pseudonocardia acaciae]|uniref:hypothetical protein n=1 Tax=Pseudonocardia acaciae TaxID=551276 RepID=UPI00048DFB06|nr:hypothetical protein [Pseudonocardia acaciae]